VFIQILPHFKISESVSIAWYDSPHFFTLLSSMLSNRIPSLRHVDLLI
jgi:hypothetical protein